MQLCELYLIVDETLVDGLVEAVGVAEASFGNKRYCFSTFPLKHHFT